MILNVEIPFPQIDPAAFTIPLPQMDLGPIALGPFPIRWYALAYIFGLLIGWWYASRIASRTSVIVCCAMTRARLPPSFRTS